MFPLNILCISVQVISKLTVTRRKALTVLTSSKFLSFVHWTFANEKIRSINAFEIGILNNILWKLKLATKFYRNGCNDDPILKYVLWIKFIFNFLSTRVDFKVLYFHLKYEYEPCIRIIYKIIKEVTNFLINFLII